MNFNAEELTSGATSLLQNLTEGLNIESIISSLQLPQLDQFSQLASSLLPQNLVNVDSEGKFNLLNPLELQDTIKAGIDGLQDVIKQEIDDVIGEVTSIVQQASDTANSVGDTLKSLGSKLTTDQLGFFEEAFSSASGLLDMGADMGVISNFGNTVSTATNAIRELSPKQIRDLADPAYREKIISTTLQTANSLLENEVLSTATEFASLPVSSGAVSSLFSTVNTLLGTPGPKSSGEPYQTQVRVSTYYGKGDGGDIDAYNKKSATKQQLISGKSCAVDNVKILYNSTVEVPGLGTFKAVDKLRSGGIDLQLYYDDINKANEAKAKLKGNMVVKVTPPAGGTGKKVELPGRRGNDAKLV